MENTKAGQAAADLAELKDLEMAGFVAAAKDPLWVWPIIGLLAGFFLASFEINSPAVVAIASISYVLGIAIIVGLVIRRRGVQPRVANMPSPLKRIFAFYSLSVTVVAAAIMGIGFGLNFILAGVAAFVLISIGGLWYHVRWRDAVDTMVAA